MRILLVLMCLVLAACAPRSPRTLDDLRPVQRLIIALPERPTLTGERLTGDPDPRAALGALGQINQINLEQYNARRDALDDRIANTLKIDLDADLLPRLKAALEAQPALSALQPVVVRTREERVEALLEVGAANVSALMVDVTIRLSPDADAVWVSLEVSRGDIGWIRDEYRARPRWLDPYARRERVESLWLASEFPLADPAALYPDNADEWLASSGALLGSALQQGYAECSELLGRFLQGSLGDQGREAQVRLYHTKPLGRYRVQVLETRGDRWLLLGRDRYVWTAEHAQRWLKDQRRGTKPGYIETD